MKKILLCLSLFLSITAVKAQDIKWDGEIRLRSELDGRDFKNSTAPNYYALSRIRLGMEAKLVDDVQIYIQIQDSRVFGEEVDASGKFNTINNMKNIDLHQGYIKIDKFLYEELSVKVGRQKLAYANERMIGPGNWGNIGRAFDGGLIRYEIPNHKFDIFVMNTGETNPVPTTVTPTSVRFNRDAGQLFSGLYYSVNCLNMHQFDLYGLHQLDRGVTVPGYNDLSRFTTGFFGKGKLSEQIFYEGDLAIQTGSKAGTDIFATLIALTAGYKFDDSPLSLLSLSFERLSGTPANDSKIKSFEQPYPTGHKYYGFMDYFTNIPQQAYNRGLVDIYAKGIFSPYKNLTVSATLHNFTLAEDLAGENSLGQEIDLVANWRYKKYLNFECGGSLFFPGKIFQAQYGYDVAQWAYLSVIVNF